MMAGWDVPVTSSFISFRGRVTPERAVWRLKAAINQVPSLPSIRGSVSADRVVLRYSLGARLGAVWEFVGRFEKDGRTHTTLRGTVRISSATKAMAGAMVCVAAASIGDLMGLARDHAPRGEIGWTALFAALPVGVIFLLLSRMHPRSWEREELIDELWSVMHYPPTEPGDPPALRRDRLARDG